MELPQTIFFGLCVHSVRATAAVNALSHEADISDERRAGESAGSRDRYRARAARVIKHPSEDWMGGAIQASTVCGKCSISTERRR
jgi:hypothetical protein